MNLQFKALQDETRRHILEMLRDRDLTAGEIADSFAMSAPSISYHLDLLRRAGLVSSRKQGQFVTYSLETTVLDESLSWILDLVKKGKSHAAKTKTDKARLAGNGPPHRPLHLPGGAVG
jgi:ArsR family transcriptional regulator